MNNDDIEAIRSRRAAITQGQWESEITEDGFLQVVVAVGDKTVPKGVQICGFGDMEDTEAEDHRNAEFIAGAPAFIDALLADAAALRAENERLRNKAQAKEAILRGLLIRAFDELSDPHDGDDWVQELLGDIDSALRPDAADGTKEG